MKRLSGDQNGKAASSVPVNGCAVTESSDRTHSRALAEASRAVNASLRPSGEMAAPVALRPTAKNVVPSGGETMNRVTAGERARSRYVNGSAIVVNRSTAVAACQRRRTRVDRGLVDAASVVAA